MIDRARKVVLLIDYDNLQICASRDTPGRELQLEPVVHLAQQYGTVMVARAYAEWNLSTERLSVYKSGIEPAYAPVLRTDSDRAGKSLADTVMVAEAMDLLWTLTPDVLVMATSDKDLIPLARVAKQRGARVVVLGSDFTAVPLREMADEHITYKQLITDGPARAIENAAAATRGGGGESTFRRVTRDRDRGGSSSSSGGDRDREQRDREQREQSREGRELRPERERPEPRTSVHRIPAISASASASAPALPPLPAALPAAAVPPAAVDAVGAEGDSLAGGRRRRRRGSRRRLERLPGEGGLMDDVLDEGEGEGEEDTNGTEVFEGSSGAVEDAYAEQRQTLLAATLEAVEEVAEEQEEAELAMEDATLAIAPPPILPDALEPAVESPRLNGVAEQADLSTTESAEGEPGAEAAPDAEADPDAPKPRARARRVASASRGRTRRV